MRILADFTGSMSTNTGGATYAGNLLPLWERVGEDRLHAVFSSGQVPPMLAGLTCAEELESDRRATALHAFSERMRRAPDASGDALGYAAGRDPATRGGSVDRIIDLQLRIPRMLAGGDFDVAYFPGNSMPFRLRGGTPTVLAIRLLLAFHYPGQLPPARQVYSRLAALHGVRRADRLIVPTSATADDLMKFARAPRSKIVVVPHGVDLERFSPPPDPASPRVDFIFVSRPWDYKGLLTVIRAMRVVRERHQGARLLVADGGIPEADASRFRELGRRLGIRDALHFEGRVGHGRLPDLYRNAIALVLPTSCETFGNMFLEAAACGCPVITGVGHGIDESIGPVARQVPAHSHHALAAAMSAVAEAEPKARLEEAQRLREWAERWPWEQTLAETRAVLREVARR